MNDSNSITEFPSPDIKKSDRFPYCEATGKACFLCENEHATRNVGVSNECTACVPSVTLPKSAQRVLEHMASHILFDSSVNRRAKPCGLCLRTSPLCAYYLKRGKGAGASEQVDPAKSVCANKIPFAYAIAAISTSSSPSSNVPLRCPICPTAAPCVWRYNLSYHMRSKHPAISLQPYESLWQITNVEKSQLKEIWNNRHKHKKTRKSKKKNAPGLIISEAHSSCLTLRDVNDDMDADMSDTVILGGVIPEAEDLSSSEDEDGEDLLIFIGVPSIC